TSLITAVMDATSYAEAARVLPLLSPARVGAISAIPASLSLCVDVAGGATATGTPVQPFPCNGTPAQQWTLGAGANFAQALGKCLDVVGGGTANDTRVQLWDCNGTEAQVWLKTPRN